jgi:hypothetical protein
MLANVAQSQAPNWLAKAPKAYLIDNSEPRLSSLPRFILLVPGLLVFYTSQPFRMPSSSRRVLSRSHINTRCGRWSINFHQLVGAVSANTYIYSIIECNPLSSESPGLFLQHHLSTNDPTTTVSYYSDRLSSYTTDEPPAFPQNIWVSNRSRSLGAEVSASGTFWRSSRDLKIFKIPTCAEEKLLF